MARKLQAELGICHGTERMGVDSYVIPFSRVLLNWGDDGLIWSYFATFVFTVPIGKSEGDGLTFPVNPRFGPDGRWRPRREWPKELQ